MRCAEFGVVYVRAGIVRVVWEHMWLCVHTTPEHVRSRTVAHTMRPGSYGDHSMSENFSSASFLPVVLCVLRVWVLWVLWVLWVCGFARV